MNLEEWESLCDGCGKCCLHKLEDEDTGEVFYTNVACRLLDLKSCRCKNYQERTRLVPDCLDLKHLDVANFSWLPTTCAYRLVAEKQDLPDWHPLMSGMLTSVIYSGVSVQDFAVPESDDQDLEDHIIDWLY